MLQKYSWDRATIQRRSTCGLLDAFSLRCACVGIRCSLVTLRSTRSSRFSGTLRWLRFLRRDGPELSVFRVLGTPTEEIWPGLSSLPDYKPSFPHWSPQDLRDHVPTLNAEGIDLLKVRYPSPWHVDIGSLYIQLMLTYDTSKRISGKYIAQRFTSMTSRSKHHDM